MTLHPERGVAVRDTAKPATIRDAPTAATYLILGFSSAPKSRAITCAPDRVEL